MHLPGNVRNLVSRMFSNTLVETNELSEEDVIIVLMGPTGSGKSTFIEAITGTRGIVGHGLKPFTSEVTVYKISFPDLPGSDIHFVDTPGFDDTTNSDVDTFKTISDWLHNTYRRKIQVTGLLYFHRISDNRMTGTALKNLNLFESLCGPEFNTIVLATTMWDEVEERVGHSRQQELQETYWKPMIDRGSSVHRFLCTRISAFEALEPILGAATTRKVLLFQKEVEDLGLMLTETRAGQTLSMQLGELVHSHEEKLTRIGMDLQQPSLSPAELKSLMEEYQKISVQIQKTITDANRMKTLTTSKPPTKFRKMLNFFQVKTPRRRQEPEEEIGRGKPSNSDQRTEDRNSLSSASPSPMGSSLNTSSLLGSSPRSWNTATSSSSRSSSVSLAGLQPSPRQRRNSNTFPTISPAWGQFAHPSYQPPPSRQQHMSQPRSNTARPPEHPTLLTNESRRAATPQIDGTRYHGPTVLQAGPSSQASHGISLETPSQSGIRQVSQEIAPPVPAFPWPQNSPR